MKVEITFSLCTILFQQYFIVKIQTQDTCSYRISNGSLAWTNCDDDCCSTVAPSLAAACCSHVSLGTLAIPFFIIAGICVLGICIMYCRPFWKAFLCGTKCPCQSRTRVSSPRIVPPNDNPVYVLNNDDLPDYETITKDLPMKDMTPPPYNFVATHPNDFGIDPRVPSAPPQYNSRRGSLASTNRDTPIN